MKSFTVPTMPNIDLSRMQLDPAAVTGAVKDAVYITVGLGVLAVQKVQATRRDATKALADQFGNGKLQIDEIVEAIEARVATLDTKLVALETKLDSAVDGLEQRLPERVGALLGQAHDAAKTARKQVRGLVSSASAAA